jgi:hypothetical protein
MQGMQGKSNQQIIDENLARGSTIQSLPDNFFQTASAGARRVGDFVNQAGNVQQIVNKLFPSNIGNSQRQVPIPTSFNFAPKQAPTGEVIPAGLQTQSVPIANILQAIKPADVLGISGAERAYGDIGAGKAPQPMDVVDTLGVGAVGLGATGGLLKATKGMPVGLNIKEVSGLLQTAPRSEIGFYSAVEQAALASPRKSATGQAFLNDIMKGQDVRADEIKWMGLDDYLKGKQNVTKQEVQDYIANNRVNVQEVQLGNNPTRWQGKSLYIDGQLAGEIRDTSSGYAWKTPDGQYNLLNSRNMLDAVTDVEDKLGISVLEQQSNPTRFSKYQLSGGENYRELLLTMPDKRPTVFTVQADSLTKEFNTMDEATAYKNTLIQQYPNSSPNIIQNKSLAPDNVNYKSSHFPDQTNILAHLRVNDRVDADGKKMLLIEEVQSDWHQAGRDKGYASAESKNAESAFQQYSKELANKYDLNPEQNLSMYATLKRMQPEEVTKYEQLQSAFVNSKGGVPDAPFKDTWYQLALKRAIQHAAENGYDRIGLTTGSQQAARFDLSKQVNAVSYHPDDKGGGMFLNVFGKNNEVIYSKLTPENEVANVIGKETAKKLLEQNPIDDNRVLQGLDLKIGGEGMKKYYDEIYPKFLDKYGKKWGAKIGETSIETDKNAQSFAYFKDWFKENHSDVGGNSAALSQWEKGESSKYVRDFIKDIKTQAQIRYLDITPEMKAGVSKGQPLFAAVPAIPAAGLLAPQEQRR